MISRNGYGRIAALVLILGSLPGLALAQSKVEAEGRKLIDQAIAALGGGKFLTMEDRIETGRAYSFYEEQLNGLSVAKIYTRYLGVTPGKTGSELGLRELQAFGKKQEFGTLFRENGAWEYTYRGSRPLDPEKIERYKESTLHNFFYILRQRLKEPGLTFESRGVEVIENRPLDTVEIFDSEDRSVLVHFDSVTHLPVRQMWEWRDPKTRERNVEVTRFSRYRDVGDGIQWPHQILRERNGEKIYEMFSESVEVNKGLTDNIFSVDSYTTKK